MSKSDKEEVLIAVNVGRAPCVQKAETAKLSAAMGLAARSVDDAFDAMRGAGLCPSCSTATLGSMLMAFAKARGVEPRVILITVLLALGDAAEDLPAELERIVKRMAAAERDGETIH